MEKQFSLRKTCANCPFRKDAGAIELNPGRREGIILALLTGEQQTFNCHATVYRKDGRNFQGDEYRPVDVSHCPGAAAVARKFGRDTVAVQIAERLGMISPDHFDSAADETLDPADLDIEPYDVHL